MKNCYLFLVEGSHDLNCIYKILKNIGIKKELRSTDDLNCIWSKLIPNNYPFKGKNLERLSPIPSFYESSTHSIAIKVVGSDSALLPTLDSILSVFKRSELINLKGILLFCDADTQTAQNKVKSLTSSFISELSIDYKEILKTKSISYHNQSIKTNFYVFPDNINPGTLEDILLESAQSIYPDLLTATKTYINSLNSYTSSYRNKDMEKCIISCMCAILKPGKALQSSLHDNEWISSQTITSCQSIESLFNFVKNFIS